MKYSELHATIDNLRDMADWLESNPKAIELPGVRFTAHAYVTEYARDEDGSIDYENVDEFNTRLKMRGIAKALGSCSKDYSSDSFTLTKRFGEKWRNGSVVWTFQTVRKAICRKVVTETKEIPEEFVPSRVIPARVEEVVEWVCDDPLLAVEK